MAVNFNKNELRQADVDRILESLTAATDIKIVNEKVNKVNDMVNEVNEKVHKVDEKVHKTGANQKYSERQFR